MIELNKINGNTVLVIEKNAEVGGNTLVSGGQFQSVMPYLVWDPADPDATTGVYAFNGETYNKVKSVQGCINELKMILNWFEWERDYNIPKIHPTQKPVRVLQKLIRIFTDPGDVVIDPCAGSGSTLRAAHDCGRNAYGFEVSKTIYRQAMTEMLNFEEQPMTLFDFAEVAA